jgi:uncharacterized Tic20 family protein
LPELEETHVTDELNMTPPPAPTGAPTNEERQWGLFAHLSALSGFVIPFGSVLGPLIVWQVKKNEMPFVDDQGKEALNFQITVFLAILVCLVLTVVLIGFLLLPLVALTALVFSIIGGIKANEGVAYRYPFALRLIK